MSARRCVIDTDTFIERQGAAAAEPDSRWLRRELCAVVLGMFSLLSQGTLPILLGALNAAHRLSASEIGIAAAAEALAITVTSAVAGALLEPRRLRPYAALSVIALCAANLAIMWIGSGVGIVLLRGVAGIFEGVLFWVAVGMIARSGTCERWAAVLVTGTSVLALLCSAALTAYLLPKFGANGGFAFLAAVTSLAAIAVPLMPNRYPQLQRSGRMGSLSLDGYASLVVALLYTAAGMGVFIYLLPLAQSSGLDSQVGGEALTALLAGQVLGSSAAILFAGRIGYQRVLPASAVMYAAIWLQYAAHPPAWLFICGSTAMGFVTFFSIPFLYPLSVAADPSRRTAVQSGPAQMLGSAVGPLLAAFAVAQGGMGGLLWLGVWLLIPAMVLITSVYLRVRMREQAGALK